MSLSAKRFKDISGVKLSELSKSFVRDFNEQDRQYWYEGLKIWQIDCMNGDEARFFDLCCEVFPSILADEYDDMGAWYDHSALCWVTYSSRRRIYPEQGIAFFGDESHWDKPNSLVGSFNAAWQLIRLMQEAGLNGKIFFSSDAPQWQKDENMMYVSETYIPQHFAWEYNQVWSDAYAEEKAIQSEVDRLMEFAVDEAVGFRYIGEGYYESLNPNDFMFYERQMIPDEAWEKGDRISRSSMEERVRASMSKPSPYAPVFQKALARIGQ